MIQKDTSTATKPSRAMRCGACNKSIGDRLRILGVGAHRGLCTWCERAFEKVNGKGTNMAKKSTSKKHVEPEPKEDGTWEHRPSDVAPPPSKKLKAVSIPAPAPLPEEPVEQAPVSAPVPTSKPKQKFHWLLRRNAEVTLQSAITMLSKYPYEEEWGIKGVSGAIHILRNSQKAMAAIPKPATQSTKKKVEPGATVRFKDAVQAEYVNMIGDDAKQPIKILTVEKSMAKGETQSGERHMFPLSHVEVAS